MTVPTPRPAGQGPSALPPPPPAGPRPSWTPGLVAALVLGGLALVTVAVLLTAMVTSSGSGDDSDPARRATDDLVAALHDERTLFSHEYTGMPLPAGLPADGASARRATDSATQAFRDAVTRDDGTVAAPYQDAEAALAALGSLRQDVDGLPRATPGVPQDVPTTEATSAAFERYSDVIETVADARGS